MMNYDFINLLLPPELALQLGPVPEKFNFSQLLRLLAFYEESVPVSE